MGDQTGDLTPAPATRATKPSTEEPARPDPKPPAGPSPRTVHPVDLYLESLAPSSRSSVLGSLNAVARVAGAHNAYELDWASLRLPDLLTYRSAIQKQYALASTNKMLALMRGVLRACWQLQLIDTETYYRAREIKNVPGQRLPAGRMLTSREQEALFRVCAADRTPTGARDAAAFSLMLGCGLRRGETVALEFDSVIRQEPALRVVGKGNRERWVPCAPAVMQSLDDWIDLRGTSPGRLLVSLRTSAGARWNDLLQPLAPNGKALAAVLRRRSLEAGIEPCSTHDLRRTFVSGLLDANVDPFTVQALAGHASPQTTALYDRRSVTRFKTAVERLDVPYVNRN